MLFVITLAFGFRLSRAGKPYNGLLFNIHKLIALGGVVMAVIQLSKMFKTVDLLAPIIFLLVMAAICVIALFASGTLMSLGKMSYALTLSIHHLASVVLVITLGVAVYLLDAGFGR